MIKKFKQFVEMNESTNNDELYLKYANSSDSKHCLKMLSDEFNKKCPNNILKDKVFYKGFGDEKDYNANEFAGYFTDDKAFPYRMGKHVHAFFLNMIKPYKYDYKGSGSDGDFPGYDDKYRNTYDVVKKAGNSYDGYILYDVGEYDDNSITVDDYIIYKKNNVKLAEVTYDDKGNIIPLSQRFDMNNDDARY